MSARETDLVILDFDGVVADSEVISLTSLQTALHDFGACFDLSDLRQRFLGKSLKTIKAEVSATCPNQQWNTFDAHWHCILMESFTRELAPVPGIVDLLDRIEAKGLPYCVASSSRRERISFALNVMGLTSRFPNIFSAQQVERGKPAPDLFLFAADNMGVAPEHCIVIEDSPFGVQGAKAAGMRTIGFLGGKHLVDLQNSHRDLLLAEGVDEIAGTLSEITFD